MPTMHPTRWGDPARVAPLPEGVRRLVDLVLGTHERPTVAGALPAPALTEEVLDRLRAAVGAEHVDIDDDTRRSHTRGKSTPDLLRARAGDLVDAPDAVVRPADEAEVAAVLAVAGEHRVAVVPFGGGTSVTGGLTPQRAGFAGVVALDLGRLDRLVAVDPVSHTATLQAGLRGPRAEALLAEHGFTLGHFPQSFEWASIGGFAATRSSGQSSAGYGRFDAMVVGLTVVTPTGTVELGRAPASAAGPDLRQVFLGSEGALGVITSLTVRVRPVPERRAYTAWRFPDFAGGVAAMRRLAQEGRLPAVLRLSDETESAVNLSSPERIGVDQPTGCVLVVGHEGDAASVEESARHTGEVLREAGGEPLGPEPGEAWARGRFAAPYLRDALLDVGVLVETVETATFWSAVPETYAAVRDALRAHLDDRTLVLCHVSHVYETGCSLYFTVVTPDGATPLTTWAAAKAAAGDAIVAAGATITHHHAVGTDHRPWLAAEVGTVGVRMLRALKRELDPAGILNPGVLVDPPEIVWSGTAVTSPKP